jgi:hypothetical protein
MVEISDADWILQTRKKVSQFNSFTDHLVICLDRLEKSNAKNALLEGALCGLKDGLLHAPEKISYERDKLLEWINGYLQPQDNN